MDRELLILSLIEENEAITQRELAKGTGLALGTVNHILQKMVNDGWIEILQITPRIVRYHVTENGYISKAEILLACIEESYQMVNDFKREVKGVVEQLIHKGHQSFFLLGEENTLYRLVKLSLLELKRHYPLNYEKIPTIAKAKSSTESIVLTWEIESPDHAQVVNLLYLKKYAK